MPGEKLSNFMLLNCLEQLISEPTHFPRDDIETCIDLIFIKPSLALTNLSKSLLLRGNCSNLSPRSVNGYQECEASSERILYDDFEFQSTIATEFNLVCDQQYKVIII